MQVDKKVANALYNALYWNTHWNNLKLQSIEFHSLDDETDEYFVLVNFRNFERPVIIPMGISQDDKERYHIHIMEMIEHVNDLIYLDFNNGIPYLIKLVLIKFNIRLLNDECEYIWR